MKILHTADWHLGKIVHGLHMTSDQKEAIDKLLGIIKAEQPDVVVIAGDLYDRAIPPREAVELLNDFLTVVTTEWHIPIVAISGNHDSPDRLGFGANLFQANQLYLATTIEDVFEPVILECRGQKVTFHLVPYLEPEQVKHYFQEPAIQTHQQAMERIVQELEPVLSSDSKHVLVGHAFIAGGMESESEERLTMVGGAPYIDVAVLEPFDYVALGHLHQPQKIKRETVRYSGSLMKYSFSEANHHKSVTLADIGEEIQLKKIALQPRRDLRVIEGYFADLLAGKVEPASEDYLLIRLLDDGAIMDPVSKLRRLFPNILRLERKQLFVHQSLKDIQTIKERQEMSHEQLFAAFYKEMKKEELPEERAPYVKEVIQQVMTEEREK
ncbi:exonuclease SbcCD subunit D [Gracilibacillus alcaliphilus]|uniref:exonuclease SbcCD subunit D n=1 Tax=Gracilibacillus alcaliphilus TaxID=1401441 RepID=UPI001958C139|nr:exonuclease SbcCD subunit D [Gracilibacillus alcaliphilus]MBM7675258.1 exonuclease SbcD [Gracilibacillus alcaliphilus]